MEDHRTAARLLPKSGFMANIDIKEAYLLVPIAKEHRILTAACPAVRYGWLYTKILERQKYLALLKYNDFEAKIKLSTIVLPDLQWWKQNILSTSNSLRADKQFALEIYTDASKTGWGAVCDGKRVNGGWKDNELSFHINYLELLAVILGLKSFAFAHFNCSILLRVDNTTAICYINRMGGIRFPHLNDLTKTIWQWCEKRNIFLLASYINTHDNREADEESRKVNVDTEWELSERAFKTIVQSLGEPEIDIFASRTNAKCLKYISWKPDPDAMTIDAFTVNWNSSFFYAFPPFALILRCLRKIISDKATGILATSPTSCQPFPGGRDALRTAFKRLNTPEIALDLMLASISDNTMKQYSSTYRLWWQFCIKNEVNTFEAPLSSIISFLVDLYENGASYGSINSHRSALSLLLGNNIGSDERIKRLLKGIYRQKPSLPKYTSTWDPKTVLDYVSKWYPNNNISLTKLTKKMTILFALCTSHRVQTLSLIRISNIIRSPSGAKIFITDIIKTSAPNQEHPVLFLPYFAENPSICPARTLDDYLIVTSRLRPEGTDNLLLTHKKPYKKASSQTISRWIKQTLAESGVDVTIFTAYSTRHASTSAAASAGVCIDTIRKTAGWSTSSMTFAKFYNRPLTDEGEFARSVCAISINSNK
ncbi:unnamed protein product [Parnassius mnemosyne]|uniref:Tyr recombinase domain-containing protein n=1 Tax=Parnassius mnemosyne TaxID=213953 RepID=A0AAV1M4Z6_9NEOP